ncbi:DNA polymerase III subunit epsilon [Malaciobacter pacificus]|uniref:DNA polymerase III, epsilon subunit n=1 Tax=Malaciobacter pacificus TaxID=1080223 RepID=A0A5C2HD86_9BACT|nr:3'-5' exonuclease [Malaciobacter pacificus]QEP34794.1 DNA polymerase III, epsilon subunit [Malaciobacter pacificus]GGD43706.1 DNA polymerase III subunit epsilon [Malaciobacter pacificus]
MKSFKRTIVPKLNQQKLINHLLKEPILIDEFLDKLSNCTDSFFDNPELELELLVANGLPLDFHDDSVYMKTTKTNFNDQVFCVVDIETNGGSVKKGFQIIELGAVKIKNGEIIDKFESLVYAKEIPPYVQEVTNIRPKMLENAPVLDKVLREFKIFLEDDVFVAHDIKFDYTFISDSLEKYDLGKLQNRKLCTIDLAKRTIKAEKYGLSSLKEVLNINVNNHHRAYYDALTTAIVLKECFKNIDTNSISTTEELLCFSKSDNIINKKNRVKNDV